MRCQTADVMMQGFKRELDRGRPRGLLTRTMLHELVDELVALTADAPAPQQHALLAMA
jgi:hypothetical protein